MRSILNKIKNIPQTVKISVAYTICSILQKCLTFFTLPLFTRILTTEEYGQFSVYSSWAAIVGIFVTLNLGYGSFSTAMAKFEKRRDEYIASVQGISLLMVGLFLIVYFPFQKQWNNLFGMPTALVIVMILELLGQSTFLFWCTKKRFEFKYKSVVATTLLMSVASPALAFLLIAFSSEKGYARIIGYATVNIVVGLFFLVFNQYKGKKMFDKDFWKYSLSFAIPLIPYYLSQVVFNQSDRIMIDKICGTDKAAIYSVAYTVALILNFVLNAINNSYVPWFYQAIKEKKWEESKKVASGISLLMAVLLLGIIWLAPEIIYIMAGKAYYEAVWIIPPVAMSLLLLFYAQLFINTAFYYEKKGFLVWASVWSAILNIVLNAIFIPMAGYVVAGYTTFVSYILFALLNYYGAQKHIKMDISMRNLYDLKVLTLVFAGFVVLSFGAMVLYSMFVVRYVVIAVTFVVVFLKRNTLINYLKMFKKNEVE